MKSLPMVRKVKAGTWQNWKMFHNMAVYTLFINLGCGEKVLGEAKRETLPQMSFNCKILSDV